MRSSHVVMAGRFSFFLFLNFLGALYKKKRNPPRTEKKKYIYVCIYTHTHLPWKSHKNKSFIAPGDFPSLSLLAGWLVHWKTLLCWLVGFPFFFSCVCGRELFFNPSPHTDHFLILYSVPFSLSIRVLHVSHSTWAIKARRWNGTKKLHSDKYLGLDEKSFFILFWIFFFFLFSSFITTMICPHFSRKRKKERRGEGARSTRLPSVRCQAVSNFPGSTNKWLKRGRSVLSQSRHVTRQRHTQRDELMIRPLFIDWNSSNDCRIIAISDYTHEWEIYDPCYFPIV
jgi:hypothetical protein